MRNEDSIAQQIRDIQLDIQELKARQYTGENQVVVKEYTTDPITFSTSATSSTTCYKRCYVRVTADGLPEGAVLLAFVVPKIMRNGEVVQNNSTSGNVSTVYFVNPFRSSDLRKGSFYLFLSDASTDGNNISSRTYSVSFKIYASAKVSIETGVV